MPKGTKITDSWRASVFALLAQGKTLRQVSEILDSPLSTVRDLVHNHRLGPPKLPEVTLADVRDRFPSVDMNAKQWHAFFRTDRGFGALAELFRDLHRVSWVMENKREFGAGRPPLIETSPSSLDELIEFITRPVTLAQELRAYEVDLRRHYQRRKRQLSSQDTSVENIHDSNREEPDEPASRNHPASTPNAG